MWVRYHTAPWWGRWLIISLAMTLWLALYNWTLQPRENWWTTWPAWLTATALVTAAMLLAAPFTVLTQPVANSYAAVLRGLTAAQRAQVGHSLRHGPIPTDPAVLGAAVRAMDLSKAYRERVSPTRRRLVWVIVALFAVVLPVVEFVGHRPRMGLLYLTAGVVLVASEVVPTVLRRRRGPHLAELRAAAGADPQVAALVADAVPPASPTVRQRLIQAGVVATVVVAAGLGSAFTGRSPGQDCRTAAAVVKDISEHRSLLDTTRIGPGGPELAEYRQWAQRLQRRADEVRDPAIQQHLRDIAGLSGVAVAIVEQIRKPGLPSESIAGYQTHYANLMAKLVEADKGLVAVFPNVGCSTGS
ncbi:hypothetical protein H7J87_00065 [Mycolicibacterium wolinskyi]|uniref:Uncharacterized protein n=1 Tax=Mycolicibacterium wolinskyi TaxID=59750 RepID=A0A1X2F655_9MYCO|nr:MULTISPECIES: hypothetical protein [Mycolicibacterium]MCV7283729.1 hypothetical protein [Mycolicibacterium wolinskyi]MCV7292984.1 hypothetical protein [Mycolicibacterium goodii]ORX13489.1 hypothetical protein AWC31_30040 [Mycolicibacterium wolinskyi]